MDRTFFIGVYRNFLLIGPPLVIVGMVLLATLIAGIVKTTRKAILFRVPLVEKQEVSFQDAGSAILSIESPSFSVRPRLSFALSTREGEAIRSRPVLFRQTTSGFSKSRVSLRVFHIPHPGKYVLTVGGLEAFKGKASEHEFSFSRSILIQTFAQIVGLILSAGVLIASVVFFILRLRGSGPQL